MAYFLPSPLIDDTSTNKDDNKCIARQVMGEEVDHLTKMVSTCKINRHINIMDKVITFLGNCWT